MSNYNYYFQCVLCRTSSRPDIISITTIYVDRHDDCSHKVIITPTSREQRRSTAVVLAEDISTGEVLRCDVILDVIHQLGVLTTTRELYLEEAPETFKMWAFDSQGEKFYNGRCVLNSNAICTFFLFI